MMQAIGTDLLFSGGERRPSLPLSGCLSGSNEARQEDNNNLGSDLGQSLDSVKVTMPPTPEDLIPVLAPVLIVGGASSVPVSLGSRKSIEETLASLNSIDSPICRICHCGDGDSLSLDENISISGRLSEDARRESSCVPVPIQSMEMSLINPCFCAGSLKWVHHYCLSQWIRSSNHKHCELCKFHFKMSVKYKPFLEWERLEMSPGERKKLLCNLLFNLISMFCVFWSIYVLIERATLEAKYGLLDWPFWTKMLVVSIGFLGGTVFLFVQLRLYFTIFLRWRQFNRVIVIHNIGDRSKESSPQQLRLDSVEIVK